MNAERNQSSNSLPKSSNSVECPFPTDKELAFFQKQSKNYAVSNRDSLIDLWREFRKGQNTKNGVINKEVFMATLKEKFKISNNSIIEHLFRSKL